MRCVGPRTTADAISCGHSTLEKMGDGATRTVEPIEVLCRNLLTVVRRGGKWICVSYSTTRFQHLHRGGSAGDMSISGTSDPPRQGWKVIAKRSLRETSGQRTIKDGSGERIVYEPSTSVSAYILEKIS
ncbi:hypothetical protein BD324DRAFT_617195 [Kockovaella imperatae]|uniref:Uncharacterized protein n=1 Tax=Kockovaella imperatae TaxID=4999 RepID=A0A1Y1UQE4_9TREE|nr:hypothetical protein BD324DRAFT_617195 [Kockovaella imperatae]ORX40290.1 hypothetical protein BD324DRAFT_617195 [Kockovaella imperatae]